MALGRSPFWAAVLLLASLDLWRSSSSPPCPESCVCREALLLNCSLAGLSSVPQPVQDPIAELDLSHNLLSSVTFHQPHPNLRNLWLGNNSIPHLSLCIERTVPARRLGRRSAAGSRSRCLTWAPALQLLSAERNLLERLPRGLDAVESLQVLELSFNRISSLEPGVLGGLRRLRELHLQHNLITHLDPQMFQNLEQLKVLDMRFNMLTTMQQLTYLTLRDIGADVKLDGNRWHCDCNMRSIRRQMAYDSTRGMQTWSIICSEPSTILGKDLLQLDEEDLTCLSSENNLDLHRDVTVYSGAEILLSCSAQESEWWTRDGRASVSQQEDRLLISDFSEGDTGLYVCVSEEDHVLSVFNLQISKMRGPRQERSLTGIRSNIIPQTPKRAVVERAGSFMQSDMILAVCLSIILTFLLAFILGVLARPCIDRLWRRVSKKKDSPATHTVTSAQQSHYDNRAFSNAEEPEEIGPHRERRVTFSHLEVTKESNVQYYDTVVSADQQSIRSDEVFEYQEVEIDLHRRPREKQSDDSSSAELAAERLRNMKFEPIPDPDELEERRSRSSSSDSSQSASESDQTTRKHTVPKSLQLEEDSFQTRADLSIATKTETPQISTKGKSEYPGSSALHTNKANTTDSDISHGEPFEFSDGAQSPSAKDGYDTKSPGDASEYSSSASSDSSDSDSQREPVRTKIKQKTKKKQKKVAQKSKPGTSSSSYSHSEGKVKMTYVDGRGRIDIQQLPLQESKTKIDDSDERWPAVDLQHIPRLKRRLDIKALLPSCASSSCSESEDEPRGHVTKNTQDSLLIARPPTSSDSDDETTRLTVKKPRRLDVAHLSFQKSFPKSNDPADSTSFSSGDTEAQEKGNMVKQRKESLSKIHTKVSLTVPPTPDTDSNSSSSSDSDHDKKDYITQPKEKDLPKSTFTMNVTQTVTQKAPSQWPSVDLGRVTRIKRRLDIKAPKADSDSSPSNDSEDEARDQLMKQKQEELLMSRLPGKVSPTVHRKPENRWPAPELGKTTQIKKNVDIKASLTDSDSSSSSDSDIERKDHMTSKKQMALHISKVPTKETTVTQKPANHWPTLNFGIFKRIKRRLDVKASTADSSSSSSSDSEDETRGHVMKPNQEELVISQLQGKVPPTVHPKPKDRWSAPDLGKTTQIKKPAGIKASSTDSDSSSSSDSGDDKNNHITQKKQEKMHISKLPVNVTTATQKPANQWPTLDFGRTTKIKKRLDIKAPTAESESSSSDSEDETIGHVMKQKQEELLMSKVPSKVYPTVHPKPENRWSSPDLGKTTQIKKPIEVKASSTDSDSSSSSDSDNENETKQQITQKQQNDLYISKLPTNVTTITPKPANQWPTLDLGRSTKIKRRLDIKAPTAESESSSSDSEAETRGHVMKQNQEELLMSKVPSKVYPTVHPRPENRWSSPDLGKTTQIKKSIEIKASSTDSDSSSSSDSDNERKDQITQKQQEELYISKIPTNVTTATQKPANQWPTLDLGRTTKIKRRLDIKAPKAYSESSSSSDSEDETRGHVMKQKQEELLMSKIPSKVYPTVHSKPENHWSAPDLGKTTQIKKLVDIKVSSTDSSSSDSDNENETKLQITQKQQNDLYISKLPTNVTTFTLKPANQWPTLDLGRTKKIKRRLDIKAPTAESESSSSDSEDETRGHVMKQNQDELLMSKVPSKVYPTVHPKPENRRSSTDLGKTTQIKKPIDVKASSTNSDSSSSSDSDDERKDQITQKQQEELYISKIPTNVTTVTQKPANQWPTIDLGRTTKIKRRLDIKAPKAYSESSSSDSEDETGGHVMKQKQEELLMSKVPSKVYPTVHPKPENRWSAPDLGKTTQIKKPIEVKASSTDSDSSSSSDSDNENETKQQITQKQQNDLYISKLPTNVTTITPKPANQWPTLDLGRTTKIKRRLDIKAPTAESESSSSDSEAETRGHVMKQNQEELLMSKVPSKVYPTVHPRPENRWSSPDLGKTTQIKKSIEIKASSTDSDSSSSSDSDNERKDQITQKQQEELYISKIPTNVTTATQKPANQWPTLDLGRTTKIKRRLDIKAPKAYSESSSSSDSEDETRGHVMKQKQEELLMSKIPSKVYPTVHSKPENHWSAPDLGKTTQIKKLVDIKVSSTDSSSSDSDNENETKLQITQKQQNDLYISKLPTNVTTFTLKPANQWPTLDLGRTKKIKRRLDIKAPTAESESSSSDSEDETRGHVMKQNQDELLMSKVPSKVYPTVHPKPENRRSSTDLGKTTQIKKPIDVKASSTNSDSSSSSDSDDERKDQITQKQQEELYISKIPTNVTTVTQKPANQWPTIDLGRTTKIKRRLDIKAPKAYSESSSSDSEDETGGHVMKQKQEELLMSKVPSKVYPTVHPKPENRWSSPDLGKTTQIKKPIEVKASSTDSDSSSSGDSDNENETKQQITQKQQNDLYISKLPTNVTTITPKPANQWPTLDLGRTTKIKRRLDIKAPTAESESSSSDSEAETRGHVIKQNQEELLMSKVPSKVYPTVHPRPENRWSSPDLGKTTQIKKSIEIKASSTDSDSSSSSDSDNETKHQITQKQPNDLYISKLPTNVTTVTQKPANQWPTLDFGRISQLKRRLDIKAPTADKDSSSSSDSRDKTRGHVMKQKEEELLMSKLPSRVYPIVHPEPENRWSAPDLANTTQIKKDFKIKPTSTDSDSSSSSDSHNERKDQITQKQQEELNISKIPTNVTTVTQKPANQWPTIEFGRVTRIKRRLDIKAPTTNSDSSSSSNSEDETGVKKQEQLLISQLPSKVPPPVHPKPDNRWSVPDLGKRKEFKNPLDARAQSANFDSSSSSDSDSKKDKMTKLKPEDLLISKQLVQTSQKASQKQGNQWPSLDLWRIRQFKRRLDIKAPAADSNSSSGSDSDDKTSGHVVQQKQEELRMATSSSKTPAKVKLENRWPSSVFGKPDIKSPLDIKVPSPSSHSSSSSEDETRGHIKTQKQEESLILENPADITQLRSNSENQWPTLDLSQTPSIQRRLDIKTAIPRESASQSSSSGSKDENRDQKAKIRKDQSFTLTPTDKFIRLQIAPGINIPYNPKTAHNIKLEKYTDISGDLKDVPTNDTNRTTLEVDPELQSRWATMNLGVSRFRKRLEISSPATESDLNSPPGSPFSSGSESGSGRRQRLRRRFVGIQETHKSSSPGLETFQLNVSPTPKTPEDKFTFSDIVKERMNKNRSDKNSTSPSKQSSNSSSSSDSEDETKDLSVTDLSRGVPRIKRHLDIKAPSPEPSNTPPSGISKKPDATQTHKYSSLGPEVAPSPSGEETLHVFGNSSQRTLEMQRAALGGKNERKGLSALKAMSQERRNWEWDKDAHLVFDTQDGSISTHSQSEKDKVLSQPSQIHSPSVSESKKDIDLLLLYGVPRYKRHGTGDSLTEASLPDPATPQQDE